MKVKLAIGLCYMEKTALPMIMRTFIFLFCTAIFGLTPKTIFPQDAKITIEADKTVTVDEVFDMIRNQTDYTFIYQEDLFKDAPKVSLKKGTIRVNKLLEDLKIGDFEFELNTDNTVVVKKKIQTQDPIRITGTVTDMNGTPLPGVTVLVKGTSRGTSTDFDGKYTIVVPSQESILVFTSIGFATQEITVGNITEINIAMKEAVNELQGVELYSTGYEKVSVERSTGSYAQIDQELVDRNVGTDIYSRLNGLTPSLLIDERSGEPRLSIRGRSTIFANDQPLIVVDDFPYNGDLSNINPNDIESITILRDAAAASIWGVRAGNGVIVITTKRGKLNQKMSINFNHNVTIEAKPDLFYQSRMSTSDFIDVEKMLFDEGYFDSSINDFTPLSPVVELLIKQKDGDLTAAQANAQIDALRNNDVRKDLEKYFYRDGIKQQYALNINGGSDKSTYFVSAGYDNIQSTLQENDRERLTLNMNNTFRPFDKLTISSQISYVKGKDNLDNTISDIRMGSRNIYPYARLTDGQGNSVPITQNYRSGFAEQAESQGFLNWKFNPLEELGLSENTRDLTNFRLDTGLKYDILTGLSAQLKYQYQKENVDVWNLEPAESYYTRDLINQYSTYDGTTLTRNIPVGGILTLSNNELVSNSIRFQLNYDNSWQKHHLSAMGGIEQREVNSEGHGNKLYGYDPVLGSSQLVDYTTSFRRYPSGSFGQIPSGTITVSGTIDRYRSYFGNASYTYDNKYTLYVSGRIDQSNLFGVKSNQKSAPLWSSGLNWKLDKERFYNVPWLPTLGLRASYGYNGNISQNATAYTTATYRSGSITRRNAASIISPPNESLRWERNGIINLGVDFGTKNNRISGSLDFYKKKGEDLFGEAPLDPTSGFSFYNGNVANMKGKGMDVAINTLNFKGSFQWMTNVLFSYTTDEVTNYKVEPTNIYEYFANGLNGGGINPVEGKPLFSIYSFKWAGLDSETGDPRGYVDGEPSNDYASIIGNATLDSLQYHGRATPPIYGAFRNTLLYKGLSLSFNVQYKFGYYFRRESIDYNQLYQMYQSHGDFEKRWQNPGDELTTNVPSMIYPVNSNRNNFYNTSAILVEKGDHIRLQDIRLGYEFGRMSLRKLPVDRLEVYGYVNNVGLLWKATDFDIDPDYLTLRAPRTIAIGLITSF